MHKRKPRSDRGQRRPDGRRMLSGRAGGGRLKGETHPLRDLDALGSAVDQIGDGQRQKAAAAIGCNHTLLGRYLRRETKSITHTMLLKLLKAAEAVGPEAKEQVLQAVRPLAAQQRFERYVNLMHRCQDGHRQAFWRHVTRSQLERRYPDLFQEFRRWMSKRPVPVRDLRQDLAIWRVIEPLFDGFETGWMEVGWQDFMVPDDKGRVREHRLMNFLKLGIEREKILLLERGPDQLRAIRLSVAAEAHAACASAPPERLEDARSQRAAVYRQQRIPLSYVLNEPPPPNDGKTGTVPGASSAGAAHRRRRRPE